MHSFIALRSNIWPMHYSSSPLDNFGPEDYFLACKLCQKTGGHLLTTKIGTKPIRLGQAVRPVTLGGLTDLDPVAGTAKANQSDRWV